MLCFGAVGDYSESFKEYRGGRSTSPTLRNKSFDGAKVRYCERADKPNCSCAQVYPLMHIKSNTPHMTTFILTL